VLAGRVSDTELKGKGPGHNDHLKKRGETEVYKQKVNSRGGVGGV